MNGKIEHSGIVDSIQTGKACVRLFQTSACASCKAARHCNASDVREKIVEVDIPQGIGELKVGDAVRVSASEAVMWRTLFWCFGLPFLLVVSVLFLATFLGCEELVSALCSLSVLFPYYLFLYLSRKMIGRQIVFLLEKQN